LLRRDISQVSLAERPLIPEEDFPVLIDLLNGIDPDLAASAASHLILMAVRHGGALGEVRQSIATALPAMARHFDDPNPPILNGESVRPDIWRQKVMQFVWILGIPPPASLVEKLLLALRADDTATDATRALVQLKPVPSEVIEAILAKMTQAPVRVKGPIIDALVTGGVRTEPFVHALAAILDNPGERHQDAALALLGLGAAAKTAEPALRRFISKEATSGTDDWTSQHLAQQALKDLGSK